MRRWLPVLIAVLAAAPHAPAQGLLLPSEKDKDLGPLSMTSHDVRVSVEDQAAVTQVTQVFHNPTGRALEATYVFPVPKGAGVNKFTMWVDGKEVGGELVEADKARAVYTDIVRKLQDPGLLEYVGNDLLRVRVFPVPANGDQKLMVRYTSVADGDTGLIEYLYPLKMVGKAAAQKFSFEATLKSQHGMQNVYSPSHAVTVTRSGDHEARVTFSQEHGASDKDLQLFYTCGDKDVGLTALTHRPEADADGTFMLLISPRAEMAKAKALPRDMVFVLDTSGSMAGPKMDQARKALKFCIDNLTNGDRFAVMNFATTVNKYADGMKDATTEQKMKAKKWVDALEATGGTAIDDALREAIDLRAKDSGRTFTVVFFTDGEPTVGETHPDAILKHVAERNTADTRIFTFGVGDDVNAALLDKLADQTRAVSTYVRPAEDIEVKVSALYAKISHPVLTNLKLTAGGNVGLSETYPHELPDLFHGGQLVVLGRYHGHGHAALTLSGMVGKESKEFVYEVNFPEKTDDGKAFVEDLWARRKVGYLLDQIRTNGEKSELVEEVKLLAKKHGITTPYTSYLVVPDKAPVAVNRPTDPVPLPAPQQAPPATQFYGRGTAPAAPASATAPQPASHPVEKVMGVIVLGGAAPAAPPAPTAQTGSAGVDLALQLNALRSEERVAETVTKRAAGRSCREANGAWIDEGYAADMKAVTVKAQGAAYFRILERHPEMKEVFRLGNRVIWVTPSGAALVVDTADGKETISDDEIDQLFVVKK
jgi:Ca-activated chloride channel homolog